MDLDSQPNSSNPGKAEKLFGRYHELAILLIGFVLTTIVGGLLTYWYQTLAWHREELARQKQEEMARASAVFDDISRILDKRLYRLRNVEGALEENLTAAEVAAQRENYRAAVAEWNESLNRNLWLTERYFGATLKGTLEDSVQGGFRSLHKEVGEVLKDPAKPRIEQLRKNIDAFNPTIYIFDSAMLDALRRGEVGTLLPK